MLHFNNNPFKEMIKGQQIPTHICMSYINGYFLFLTIRYIGTVSVYNSDYKTESKMKINCENVNKNDMLLETELKQCWLKNTNFSESFHFQGYNVSLPIKGDGINTRQSRDIEPRKVNKPADGAMLQ